MTTDEVVDSELATLYAKVQELTRERDAAIKQADELKTKIEHFRQLWETAERRLRKELP